MSVLVINRLFFANNKSDDATKIDNKDINTRNIVINFLIIIIRFYL